MVCVAEQVLVIMRAAPQDAETGWDLSAPLKVGDSWMALDATSWMCSPFVCGLNPLLSRPLPSHATVFHSVSLSFTSQPHSPPVSPWLTSPLHLSTKHLPGSGSQQMRALFTRLWPWSAVTQLGGHWNWLSILPEKHTGSVGRARGPGGAFHLYAVVRDVLFPLTCLTSLMCCPLFCPFTQRCEPSTSLCLSPTMLPLSLPMTLPTPTCLQP